MRFPESVDNPKLKPAMRASARLRFMLKHLALYCCEGPAIVHIAKRVDVDPSLLYHYIRAGSFSEALAQKMEDTFGQRVMPAKNLIKPLDIKNT